MSTMAEIKAIGDLYEDTFGEEVPRGRHEFTDMERLAIAQAFMNKVGSMTKTKVDGNLRGRVDRQYKDIYAQCKAKSFEVELFGEKVGTFSLQVSKPTESKVEPVFEVTDEEALTDWRDFKAAAMAYAMEHPGEIATYHFGRTGELPDGCELVDVVYPGTPGGKVEKTTLSINSEEVARVLGGELPLAAQMLLEGGTDD